MGTEGLYLIVAAFPGVRLRRGVYAKFSEAQIGRGADRLGAIVAAGGSNSGSADPVPFARLHVIQRWLTFKGSGRMIFFYLLLGGLVTYRLSLLVSKEDGPAYIFRKLRKASTKNSSVKEGLSCEWCMSVWMSAVVATYFWWAAIIPGIEWPLYWLAMSAIAIICNQQWTKSK